MTNPPPTPPASPSSSPPPSPERRPPCQQAANAVSCQTCVDFLLDYIDGVLPEDQRFKFESHLAFCEDCATYLDNYRKAAALTQGVGRAERAKQIGAVPESLVKAILDARNRDS